RIGELATTLADKTRDIASAAARTNDVRDELRVHADQLVAALERAAVVAGERSAVLQEHARGVGTAADLAGDRVREAGEALRQRGEELGAAAALARAELGTIDQALRD